MIDGRDLDHLVGQKRRTCVEVPHRRPLTELHLVTSFFAFSLASEDTKVRTSFPKSLSLTIKPKGHF